MKTRSNEPELMDDHALPQDQLQAALNDISLVNKYLGGNRVTIKGLRYFFKKYPQNSYTIVDMGCGDGEVLREIAQYCRNRKIKVQLIGIDLNPTSIAFAIRHSVAYPEIRFLRQDILQLSSRELQCDIVTSTLTMHHFDESQILGFLRHFIQLAKLGVVINDLHRNRLAAMLFQPLSRIFMKTHVARHDGLISIKRAFKKEELQQFALKLKLTSYQVRWRWAFRYLWIIDSRA
ncbi:MAG: methyltransferase [Cytophagaceae bacterium]|nr:methyltransferase [Cytophagaceae bacterium]|tara:strand:+ start:3680 stop:4381 length:702 start_codon:yes stop_codon:yes gene_type:complete